MKIFLAGLNGREKLLYEVVKDMRIYMAGQAPYRDHGIYDEAIARYKAYVLESFAYVSEWTEKMIPLYGDFLLDSGAFTFRQQTRGVTDWDEYIKRYAEFIVKNNVDKFFELDIDSEVGYEKVLEYRATLEKLVGKKCIPVWHVQRGKDEFINMCKEYDYVALGGITGVKSRALAYQKYKQAFPWFIKTAHQNGAKIHALGVTGNDYLKTCHFDSVDSSSWTSGFRYGIAYKFNGERIVQRKKKEGEMVINHKDIAVSNFVEWCKFQKYAETVL